MPKEAQRGLARVQVRLIVGSANELTHEIHPGSTSGGGAGADSRARRRARDDAEVLPAEGGGGGGEGVSTASVAKNVERYRPRIYGFLVHETARLQRWQEAVRERQVERLEAIEERP